MVDEQNAVGLPPHITPEVLALVERTAELAAQKAIEGTLIKMGLDTKDPIAAQKDFAKLRVLRKQDDDEEFKADLMTLRRLRLSLENVKSVSWKTTITLVITFVFAIMGLGLKEWFTHVK